jgi:hypothetical protein
MLAHNKPIPEYPYEKYPVEFAAGTSFANIEYLWKNYEHLYRLKNEPMTTPVVCPLSRVV